MASSSAVLSLCFCLLFVLANSAVAGITRKYTFHVRKHNMTRVCNTKPVITVNGRSPGPTIAVREGDRVIVKVHNHVKENVTIHWHGVRQLRSGWSDGPAYITQCPIQTGMTFTYNFTVIGQRGTLWWHAHISWIRASVYGAFIIYPKINVPYPFPKPFREVPIVLGEWWNSDTEKVINQALQNGGGPNVSDSYLFNGHPGPLYNCSNKKDTFVLRLVPGKTYMLRLINAVINEEMFLGIANHTVTVVEVDAIYTKPHQTNIVHISPGQTTNVLLTAKTHHEIQGLQTQYFMAARPYVSGRATFDNSTVAALAVYRNTTVTNFSSGIMPKFPALNDTAFALNFSKSIRSLATTQYPALVPKTVDKKFFFTVGLGLNPCPKGQKCQGPNGTSKFTASINNISFVLPSVALLQSHFNNQIKGVYKTNFPDNPPLPFNYTSTNLPMNMSQPMNGTRVKVLPFNTTVEVVLQDTGIVGTESHPMHLHGSNFYIVGQGVGNYNETKDAPNFNLVDPPERNTFNVPAGGWVALRFRADNPGVWFMHCHLELHISWGLKMAWVVKNGNGPSESLLPPPPDLPPC
eukprot:TRINITY_DN8221_c0_g1_i1.p1 TRINITY_DN8221_c0_g1~~TRINITY_DN8221_c0_g1_i1.p1  ORF type:complete len:577 (-),score=17.83 TRINITY_DN8221_c0_g1_i1:265-1995(-)